MNLNEEQLKVIEDMGKLYYTPKLIAFNLEVDPHEFELMIKSEKGEAFNAYMRGWFESDMKLRNSTLQAAINGSTPSIQMIENYKAQQ